MVRILHILLVLILVVAVVLAGVVFYQVVNFNSPIELEDCNKLMYNGKNKIDVVFFSSKEDANEYISYFSDLNPFKNFKDKFNFYYINDYKPKCELYKEVAVLCYSKELVQKSASCPNDYIVVLNGDFESSIRSSSYLNVMSLNLKHPKSVFAHEFGHSFSTLAEEYVPATIPKGARNCVGDCRDFEGKEDGCYVGCSREDYKRSVENGVMRTLKTNKYGKFNEGLIIERIGESVGEDVALGPDFEINNESEDSFGFERLPGNVSDSITDRITGQIVGELADCMREKYYLVEGFYLNENIQLDKDKATVLNGCAGENGFGGFEYRVVDSKSNVVINEKFNPELIFTYAPGEDLIKGESFKGERFYLKIPIVKGADKLEIKDDKGELVDELYLGDVKIRGSYYLCKDEGEADKPCRVI